ncbi:beta-lactamase family protein [Shewanella submarina]|uniref:Serine hydrolase domain-containing protein n=1 Tax=Shewanella submarina TaxID=2016376 RepID=A0ABV7GB23_9GAMM|nr:serine hydrolase domain-containing protein [Shewanella submarina]MCL1037797.1 beta-lactamase family protein [Shewanella submarina]
MRLAFFALSSCLLAPVAAVAEDLQSLNKAYSSLVKRELNNKSIPGIAYTIVKGEDVIALETFGHLDTSKKKKVDKDTVFRLASVSKPFAATLTTMMAQEGQLSLTDPVTKYVPQFELAKPGAADKIQLHNLLSHSAGLMPNAYDNLLHENWSMEKIISQFDRVTPICEPDNCYGYQNIAYSMVQPAIEQVQPLSYARLLESRIFQPLGMTNASVGIDVYKDNPNTAKPHVLIKASKTGKKDSNGRDIRRYVWRTVKVEPDYYKVEPAAGVNASISDMAKWLTANLGYAPDVLSQELLTEVTEPRVRTAKDLRRLYWRGHLLDAHYGYGWRIYQFDGIPLVYHSGWVSGFRADVAYAPTLDIGFAMLMNAEANEINKLSAKFWDMVIQDSN